MSMEKSLSGDNKNYWEFVDRTTRQVDAWPPWMRGATTSDIAVAPSEKHSAPAEANAIKRADRTEKG